MTYDVFLAKKEIMAGSSGFDPDKSVMCKKAFDWQKDIVAWALKKGKSALFEDCGMGKTLQHLMWAKEVIRKTHSPVLTITPLAVASQTQRESVKFGFSTKVCKCDSEIEMTQNITNYEMLEHFDMSKFGGVILDESSILKDYTSKTKNMLIEKCAVIPYRLCCTATPSPNDYAELGNHAEFLGIMTRAEMLATFFVHDGGDTSKWRLKGHAKEKFFAWVASWACCMTSPADLGYPVDDYSLPDLNIREVIVKSGELEDDSGQIMIIPEVSQTLSERRNARRSSLGDRVKAAAKIANSSEDQYLVWCDMNAESAALTAAIDGSVEVKGSDSPDSKVERMNGFTGERYRVLVSKPSIAGWGMNWQQCHNIIFVGLSDSFEAYYQSVRRCWRYGQKHEVNVWIITSEAEGAVRDNIERKQKDAIALTQELVKYTRDILSSDIRSTERMTEKYYAADPIIVPQWLKENAE